MQVIKPDPLCFLIADISGYTEYLSGVEIDHAQDILADLISTVVTALRPTFRLAKLEGDAAFCFAPADGIDGSLLLDTIEHCYFGFRRRRRDVRQATSCECNACLRIPDLNLKFVAHSGLAIRQKVAGREELLGSDVIVVHRMLKNTVVEETGIDAYALLSAALTEKMAIDPAALELRAHTETYDHIGEVRMWIHDLERRWQAEDSRKRVLVGPEEAVFTVVEEVQAPPEVVWQFLTTPGRRLGWQSAGGVTDVIQDTGTAGRRGAGMTNHCMHGPAAIIEHILDWRPFDYFTEESTLPGNITFRRTTELEPTAQGTTVRMYFEAPKRARDRKVFEQMAPEWMSGMQKGIELLKQQARLETDDLLADRAEPPTPSARNADGFLSGIEPIQYVN